MVEDRITDGRRIAQLLASELDGRAGAFSSLSVTDADRGAEPTEDGTRVYDVADGGEAIATVFVHPDRVRLEVGRDPDVAAEAGREAGLRVRPAATDPPKTLLFVESGAEVKRAADAVAALADRAE